MQISTPELIFDAQAQLGEGPSWDAVKQRLYWVDIFEGCLHSYDPDKGLAESVRLDKQWLTCVAPTSSGKLIVGLRNSLALFDPISKKLTILSIPEAHLPGNRFNDGKAAPNGFFLAGTMDNAEIAASGSLYSLAPGGTIRKLVTAVHISNGLAWSPDHQTLYYIDTPTRQVMAFDYDLSTGDIANPRVAVNIPVEFGWPDGMTSDSSGNLWVAMWGGAALTIWNPVLGTLLGRISIPAKNVTSCAFGGLELNELYITSARKGLNEEELKEFPLTGGLFRIKTNTTGLSTFVFNDL